MNGKNTMVFMGVAAATVILLAIVVMVGNPLIDEYSYLLRTPATANNTPGVTVLNGTAVSLGTSYPFVQGLSGCSNGTDNLTAANYTVGEGDKTGGTITLAQAGLAFNGTTVDCDVTFLNTTTAQVSADAFNTGLTVFATFTSVVCLALVGVIIIGLFKKKR